MQFVCNVTHNQRFRGLFAQNLACRLQTRKLQVIIFTDPAKGALALGLAQIPRAQAMKGAVAYIDTWVLSLKLSIELASLPVTDLNFAQFSSTDK